MAEAVGSVDDQEQPQQAAADSSFDSKKDYSRMRRIGSWHATAVLVALTLYGAADWWANQSGMVLAHIVALGNAFVAGSVISSLVHEWGHLLGARLSGAKSPVAPKPIRFYFMFNFDMTNNSVKQFTWMSLGGIVANWVLVVVLLLLVPIDTWAGALLIATALGKAVNVAVFEVPIVLRTQESGEADEELQAQLKDPGLQRIPGLIVGALAWLALT